MNPLRLRYELPEATVRNIDRAGADPRCGGRRTPLGELEETGQELRTVPRDATRPGVKENCRGTPGFVGA